MDKTIWHETDFGKLYNGDCLEILEYLPDCSIDCCITSPPYWGLRDYGTAEWEGGNPECNHLNNRADYETGFIGSKQASSRGTNNRDIIKKNICPKCGAVRKDKQLGLEKSPEEYVANMVNLFREVRRVLKPDGVLWLNLGDSYAGNNSRASNGGRAGYGTEREGIFNNLSGNLKRKDLVGIPWTTALALRDDGWYLRQDIIWHKSNPMPESVTDRCTKSHEYIFMLTKNEKYYFDSDAIKEKSVSEGSVHVHKDGNKMSDVADDPLFATKPQRDMVTGEFRNKRSVWTISTRPFKDVHFATFPPDLILPCILTTKKDAVILDPFFGSGTTGAVAIECGRKYVGIELNPQYCNIAKKRINSTIIEREIF